jgi:hypothetical protein
VEDRVATKSLPDAAYLRECLDYDPGTGALTWKKRPRAHFDSDHVWRVWLANFAGKTAGSRVDRYVRVRVDGRDFYGHRIIWAMQTGAWPDGEIDHRGRDKLDNRWEMLRPATHQQNGFNHPGWKGRDLPKGVTRHRGRFVAQITVDHRRVYLGIFGTPEEAHVAYGKAAAAHFGEFAAL